MVVKKRGTCQESRQGAPRNCKQAEGSGAGQRLAPAFCFMVRMGSYAVGVDKESDPNGPGSGQNCWLGGDCWATKSFHCVTESGGKKKRGPFMAT